MTRRRDFKAPADRRPANQVASVRLRAPADVLAVIPYVVGYHQSDAIVVVGLDGTRLLFAARDELPPTNAGPGDTSHLERLRDTVTRQQVSGVMVVGYGTAAQVDPAADWLREAFDESGIEVFEVLRVTDGRYWSYLCAEPSCCPLEGTPFDLTTSTVAARATVAGRVALPDQATFDAQVQPVTGPPRTAMRVATARADQRMTRMITKAPDETKARDAITSAGRSAMTDALRCHANGGVLTDDDVAWLTVLLVSQKVRDVAWEAVLDCGDDIELHRGLWLDVMRRAESDLMPAPGTLFAFASWRCGASTLAKLALDRVLDSDPHYTMAQLLDQALAHGLPPWALDDPRLLDFNRRPGRLLRRRSSIRLVRTRRE